jgi:hypothetical protein
MPRISKKTARIREAFAEKSGQNRRSVKLIAGAMFSAGPEFFEDDDGNLVRKWKPDEMMTFTHADLRTALSNRVAVTSGEMLGAVPPSAIRYCVTKGWLVPRGALFMITLKAARELDLPMKFRGLHNGRRIPFLA